MVTIRQVRGKQTSSFTLTEMLLNRQNRHLKRTV